VVDMIGARGPGKRPCTESRQGVLFAEAGVQVSGWRVPFILFDLEKGASLFAPWQETRMD
jgi:hypothetical protein